uniref:Uncharacterized protein n=1 Tax=Branchiostoma floridae TaxID=7739 RepID=C3ZBW2_BRAFL|eukprot:XP_002594338.1 hypothetical protein BRAFLDRAFT_65190 [Branchiostoma floridae]
MTRPNSFRSGSTVGSRSVFSSVHYKVHPCASVHPYCLLAASAGLYWVTGDSGGQTSGEISGFINFVGAPNCHVIEKNLQNVVLTMCVLYGFVCAVLVFSFSVECFWLGVQQQHGSISQTNQPYQQSEWRGPVITAATSAAKGWSNQTCTPQKSKACLLLHTVQARARPRRVASMDHRLPPVHRQVVRAHSLQTQGPHRNTGLPPMGRLQSGQSGSLGSLTAAFPLGWHYGRRLSYVATGQSSYLATDPSSPSARGGSQLSLDMSDQLTAPPDRQPFSFDPPPPYSLAPPYVDQPPKYCSDEALGTSSNPLTEELESDMDRPHTSQVSQARDNSDDQVILDLSTSAMKCNCSFPRPKAVIGGSVHFPPNSIDFDKIFGNPESLTENDKVFYVVIGEWVIYLLLIIFLNVDFQRLRVSSSFFFLL